MNTIPGFDEDKYFGDESDCAPLTEAQRAERDQIAAEIEAALSTLPRWDNPETW